MSEAQDKPGSSETQPPVLPGDAADLMKLGLVSNASGSGASGSSIGGRFIPPTVEELKGAFPNLEILELLGRGGMGAVYKARQPGLDRLVAVKVLPPQIVAAAGFTERFTREARALAKLNHPNIVSVYDFGEAKGLYYIVMEFVDGANIRQTMHEGKLKPAEAMTIVPQICEALQYAHNEGIVHRDIKPENILIDKKGRVKIADFGLAKLMEAGAADYTLTAEGGTMGTPHYMAPEQIGGAHAVDHRADIYSLGVVFYEMLTGELPIGRFAAPSKKVQIDVRLDDVVLRSLEQQPEKRYQNASEVKTDVEHVTRTPKAAPQTVEYARAMVFPMRIMYRDFTDCVLSAILTPWVVGIFYFVPGVVIYLLALSAGLRSGQALAMAAVGGGFIFITSFAILAMGSVQSVRLDSSGITINRYIGPSRFLPWHTIRRIESLTRWQVIRHVWMWPGFPPRGSIMSMTTRDWYRFDCQDDCWYFSPKEIQPFLAAIAVCQHSIEVLNVPGPLRGSPGKGLTPDTRTRGIEMFIAGMGLILSGFISFNVVACDYEIYHNDKFAALGVAGASVLYFLAGLAAINGGLFMRKGRFFGFTFAAAVLLCVLPCTVFFTKFGLLKFAIIPVAYGFYAGLRTILVLSDPIVNAAFTAVRSDLSEEAVPSRWRVLSFSITITGGIAALVLLLWGGVGSGKGARFDMLVWLPALAAAFGAAGLLIQSSVSGRTAAADLLPETTLVVLGIGAGALPWRGLDHPIPNPWDNLSGSAWESTEGVFFSLLYLALGLFLLITGGRKSRPAWRAAVVLACGIIAFGLVFHFATHPPQPPLDGFWHLPGGVLVTSLTFQFCFVVAWIIAILTALVGAMQLRNRANAEVTPIAQVRTDEPQLCNLAVISSGWAILGLVCGAVMGFWFYAYRGIPPWVMLAMLLTLISIICSPITGAVAISRIRRSNGQHTGLPFAAFGMLCYPMLLLAFAAFSFTHLLQIALWTKVHTGYSYQADKLINITAPPPGSYPGMTFMILDSLVTLIVCFFAGFLAWRKIDTTSDATLPGKPRQATRPAGVGEFMTTRNIVIAIVLAVLSLPLCVGAGAMLLWYWRDSPPANSGIYAHPSSTNLETHPADNVTYLTGHSSVTVDLAVSGNGKTIASADEGGSIIIRRADGSTGDQRIISRFSGPGRPIFRLIPSQDGKRFLVSGNLKSPAIVALPFEGEGEQQIFTVSMGTISLVFPLEEDSLLAYGTGGSLAFYDIKARKITRWASVYEGTFSGHISKLIPSPDRRHFAVSWCNMVNMSSAAPYKLTIFDTQGAALYSYKFDDLHDWSRAQILFTDNDTLVACLPGGAIRRWKLDPAKGQWQNAMPATLNGPPGPHYYIASAVSPDGKTIYLAEQHTTLTTAPDGTKYDQADAPYHVMAISPSTGALLWKQEVTIGPKKSTENYTANPINTLAPIPGTQKLAAAVWDGNVAIISPPVTGK